MRKMTSHQLLWLILAILVIAAMIVPYVLPSR